MDTLEQYISKHSKNEEKRVDLVAYLYHLMDKYGMDAPTLYKKANITKQSYSSIISNKCVPSLNTLIKIVFALKADTHECKYLLKKAGYTLASSSTYALIIRYCIENKIYDLATLNEYLMKYGYDDNIVE